MSTKLNPLAAGRGAGNPSLRIGRRPFHLACLTLLLLGGAALAGASQAPPVDPSRLTLDRIFKENEFKLESWGPARWLQDGSGYTTLEASKAIKDAKDIVRYDPASGHHEIVVPAKRLIPPGKDKPLKIDGYAWSKDGRTLLLYTNSKRVWRQNTRGDYWALALPGGKLHQLGGEAEPSQLMFATLSPDGRRVAYVYHHNLYVQNLAGWQITQLTHDGSDTVINGTSDWVNEEELYLRNGFRWSPNSKFIAYWQFDTSGVGHYQLINRTDGLYPKLTSFAYPKVGQTNSASRVGVVKATGGRTHWLQVPGDPRNHYLPKMEWAPNSKSVLIQQLNRRQNTLRVFAGNPKSGGVTERFVDRDDAWVDVPRSWHWLKHGKQFLWLSERDGWRHLYRVSVADGTATLLTPGKYDVISVSAVDETNKWIYFIASPDNPAQRYLYRVALNGRGKRKRITPPDQPGTHSYTVSRDAQWAFHTYSRFGRPPVTDLVRLPDHQSARVLADNSQARGKLKALKACPHEFFRIDIGEGVQLDAWAIKPPEFDPAKQYPLFIYVYGEPAGQTVNDKWGGNTYLWHRLLAQQGYVVMSIDNRGTSAPRGRAWRKSIYRQVGILASADQAAALRRVLQDRPYLDAKRVAIWGWSGGGSMSLNAIFRYPKLYHTAMAIAFISNQRFYDTIYQERYMGLPADNADGFKNGSPLTFAHQLQGNLLLVYGSGDDNCHYQNCEVLVNQLIKENKLFSLMVYPNRTHSIKEGENTRRHLFETLTRYLNDKMPARNSAH